MYKLISLFALAAAGFAAMATLNRRKKESERDFVVENLRYRGAY